MTVDACSVCALLATLWSIMLVPIKKTWGEKKWSPFLVLGHFFIQNQQIGHFLVQTYGIFAVWKQKRSPLLLQTMVDITPVWCHYNFQTNFESWLFLASLWLVGLEICGLRGLVGLVGLWYLLGNLHQYIANSEHATKIWQNMSIFVTVKTCKLHAYYTYSNKQTISSIIYLICILTRHPM